MNLRYSTCAYLAATVAVLAGCSTSHPATATARPVISSTPEPSPVAAAASAPAGTVTGPHSLGEAVAVHNGNGKVVVLGYRQPVAVAAPRPEQAGYEWGAADVQVCALVDGIGVDQTPWHLGYADNSTVDPSSTGYSQFPAPGYPFGERPLPNGHCLRGWVTFPVPVGRRPVVVQYTPGSSYEEWAVPAS